MKKNPSIHNVSKQITSGLLAVVMLTALASCGKAETKDAKITTEHWDTQEDATIEIYDPYIEIRPGADIPEDTTASSEEETTEATPSTNGKYTYTVYGDIQLSMDVNVDDYINVADNGKEIFLLFKLATDLGWLAEGEYSVAEDDAGRHDTADWYSFVNGDCRTIFEIYDWSEDMPGEERSQVRSVAIHFAPLDQWASVYYDDSSTNYSHKSTFLEFAKHYDNCRYFTSGHHFKMSRDDLIVVAYVLWSGSVTPGEAAQICDSLDSYWTGRGTSNEIDLP